MPPRKKMTRAEEAIAKHKKSQAALKRIPNPKELKELKDQLRTTVNTAKREQQILFEQESSKRIKNKRTRSGKKLGVVLRQEGASNGKLINKGMDGATETFEEDEKEYLRNAITKMKSLHDLKFEHLQYLINYEFIDDLNKIKDGKLKSDFHDKYKSLGYGCKNELLTEIRTSLFSNDQRDYLQGLLQGAFKTNQTDSKGDIPYEDIEYVEIVMVAEAILRIVKYVYKFETFEETDAFMRRKSREVCGVSDDEDDD